MPPEGDTSPVPAWLSLIPTIVASGVSGTVMIVGFVTIARWFMRLIAAALG